MILISFYSKLIELTNRISLYILLFWIQWENEGRTRETQFWRRKKIKKFEKKIVKKSWKKSKKNQKKKNNGISFFFCFSNSLL